MTCHGGHAVGDNGARGRNRTGTAVKPRDFKSLVSTSFTTRAAGRFNSGNYCRKPSAQEARKGHYRVEEWGKDRSETAVGKVEATPGVEPRYTDLQSAA